MIDIDYTGSSITITFDIFQNVYNLNTIDVEVLNEFVSNN
jgi:hypothetical protein